MDEEKEDDIELQIEILKTQLEWDWRLNWLVILVGILIAIAAYENAPYEIRFVALPVLVSIILIFGSIWSDWPDNKAKELREKYARKNEKS